MAKLSKELMDQVLNEVSLIDLIETTGVKLMPEGEVRIGPCPFHPDDGLSLRVDPTGRHWECLGGCCGGTVIDWVMRWSGVSQRHAVELLRNNPTFAGMAPHPLKISRVRRLPCPVSADGERAEILNQVVAFYHDTLKASPEALQYLERIGLIHGEMVERFRLGYANRTLGLRLPQSRTRAGDALRERLQEIGILRESGHEHLNGCLVIPIVDAAGGVVQLYGRRIGRDVRAERAPPDLFLPGPLRGVWNIEALAAEKEIILCEGLIDALTFWCAGFRNVTAAFGIEGFKDEHLDAFRQHGTERVLIAYARTEESERAAATVAEALHAAGIDCYRLHFPKDMDANAYALQLKPAEKSLGVVIRAATWLGKRAVPAGDGDAQVVGESADRNPELADETMSDGKSSESVSPVGDASAAPAELPHASPVTPLTAPIEAEVQGDTIVIVLGDRRYRIRGLSQNLSINQMKVNVMVSRGEAFHVDQLELHSARQRSAFALQVAKAINLKETVIQKDLGKVFLKLEELQEQHIEEILTPQTKVVELTEKEKTQALELLRDPKLLERVLADFRVCGVVGEETNKLVGYLAAVSRKLDRPLAVIVQSTSAAGKSSLMDAVLAFVPEEERIQYSAITGQALYYMGNFELKHKVLALSEEEGAARAGYALKLLQSEGRLTIASTGKKPETGELVTRDYLVEGPVMIFMTTTAIDIDDELLNRCLVLTVDEDRDQTRAIHARQREAETLDGLLAREERDYLLTLHRNAQRLLRPLAVVNPYATQLTFPDQATRTRRDHTKYLTLIRAITLLHQYQREIKIMEHRGEVREYIEVTPDDIAIANRLAHEVLGRTLDELPPQTRGLLLLLDRMVMEHCLPLQMERSDYRFSRREVRDCLGWGDTQLKVHLARLVDLEYILTHRGGRGQRFVYELLYDGRGQNGEPFLPCLIDVEKLKARYDPDRSGEPENRSGSGRSLVGGQSGTGQGAETNENASAAGVSESSPDSNPEKTGLGETDSVTSHAPTASNPQAAP